MSLVPASSPAIHHVLNEDAMVSVLSYLDYMDLSHVLCASKSIQSLRESHNNYLERSLFSRVEIFDRTKWAVYWNAEITDKYEPNKIEICVLRAFLKTYWGPNPIGPGKVKDHCLIPTVVPAKVKIQGVTLHHCLNVAEFLAKQPKKGHAAKFLQQTNALEQYGDAGTEKDELVIQLKNVVGRGESWQAQVQHLQKLNASTGGEWETEPEALPQITVLFVYHAVTGERPFGFDTGMEGRHTTGRTREEVHRETGTYHMVSGYFRAGQALGSLGGSAPAELLVHVNHRANEHHGVGVARRF